MDIKTIRYLIYFFLAVIAVFSFFIFINALGGRAPAGARASAYELAQSASADARFNAFPREALPVPAAHDFSSSSVRAEGAIMIVREGNFRGVAEPPKSTLDMLNEMSGVNKRKTQPIALKDGDLDKKIIPIGEPPKKTVLTDSSVPGVGEAQHGGPGMITAPVDYKLFTSSQTWAAFADSHKCDPVKADFLKENVLILVSLSDFPGTIFKIMALEKGKKELVVRYRVDVLAMSAAGGTGAQQAYSSAVVPKTDQRVRLEQVQ